MNNLVQFFFYVFDVGANKREVNCHFFSDTLGCIVDNIEFKKHILALKWVVKVMEGHCNLSYVSSNWFLEMSGKPRLWPYQLYWASLASAVFFHHHKFFFVVNIVVVWLLVKVSLVCRRCVKITIVERIWGVLLVVSIYWWGLDRLLYLSDRLNLFDIWRLSLQIMLLELRYCKLLTSGRTLSTNWCENLVLVGWLTGLFTFPSLLGNLFLWPQLLKFSDRKNIKVILLQMSLLINLGEQIHRLIHLFALSF